MKIPLKLPRGITGFSRQNMAELSRPVKFKQFEADCYEAARQLSARVVEACELSLTANFYAVALELDSVVYGVLLNAYFPFVAFVCPPPSPSNLALEQFLEVPDLFTAFSATGKYNVLSSSILNSVPKEEVLANLAQGELKQIRYWRPRRLGNIVYNFWD